MTQDELKKYLRYAPTESKSGFVWVCPPGCKMKPNAPAGWRRPDGYYGVTINNVKYLVHRLVWLYHTGTFPAPYLDHIDGDPSNNTIENLRECTPKQNCQNTKARHSKTGVRGVHPQGAKFYASISIGGKTFRLGTYDTIEKAQTAYMNARQKHFDFSLRGAR